ncbi:MAG: polysaccharide deacetylase family protein [Gaiellaceae bacterium]
MRRRPPLARWHTGSRRILLAVVVCGLIIPARAVHTQTQPAALPRMVRPLVPARTVTLAAREAVETRRLLAVGLPVYCAAPRRRDVALTFDDGPGPYTALTLRILQRAGARATFFLVGRNLAAAASLPRQEERLGGLGDHTWTHAFLPALRPREIEAQLAETKAAIERSAGTTVTLFRPPYGAHNAEVDRIARHLRMIEVLWSVDSGDSEGASWRAIAATVTRYAHPGGIILLHENRGQTIRALKFLILPWLRTHHLVPVDLTTLLALDPPTLAQLRRGGRGCPGGGFQRSSLRSH